MAHGLDDDIEITVTEYMYYLHQQKQLKESAIRTNQFIQAFMEQ